MLIEIGSPLPGPLPIFKTALTLISASEISSTADLSSPIMSYPLISRTPSSTSPISILASLEFLPPIEEVKLSMSLYWYKRSSISETTSAVFDIR